MSTILGHLSTFQQAEDLFDDFLDQSGDVTILGVEYQRSRILKSLDPIAYRTALFDFIDGEGVDSDDLDGEPSV